MATTTDLSDFGFREFELAAELLTAYCKNKPAYLSDGVRVMMNQNSGYVFLTDEDHNVAMMNGDNLEPFLFTPYSGHEGFIDDLLDEFSPDDLHADDVEYLLWWAEEIDFDLPENWSRKKAGVA